MLCILNGADLLLSDCDCLDIQDLVPIVLLDDDLCSHCLMLLSLVWRELGCQD